MLKEQDNTPYKIGETVRVKCTAIGRYIGNGLAVYVSAMDNDQVIDEVVCRDSNEHDLPIISDDDLRKYTKQQPHKITKGEIKNELEKHIPRIFEMLNCYEVDARNITNGMKRVKVRVKFIIEALTI